MTGGGKHKYRARKNILGDSGAGQLLLADPEEGEHYAVVKKVQSGHADVLCDDGSLMCCRIGGAFRYKKRGNVLVGGGGVLVRRRGLSENEKHCDLVRVYDADEVARIPQLQRLCSLNSGMETYEEEEEAEPANQVEDEQDTAINLDDI